jgi:hypothetical protein
MCLESHCVTDIDGIIAAIDKIRQPADIKNNEESIIRAGFDTPFVDTSTILLIYLIGLTKLDFPRTWLP